MSEPRIIKIFADGVEVPTPFLNDIRVVVEGVEGTVDGKEVVKQLHFVFTHEGVIRDAVLPEGTVETMGCIGYEEMASGEG